jgi:hypothetical protein
MRTRLGTIFGTAALTVLLITGMAGTARAEVVFHEHVPVSGGFFNPCVDGELINYTANLHILFKFTEDGSGGIHTAMHTNLQNFDGETESGVKYVQSNSSTQTNSFYVEHETAVTFSFTDNHHLKRQGNDLPDDDFTARSHIHVTINANGEPTATVEDFFAECA